MSVCVITDWNLGIGLWSVVTILCFRREEKLRGAHLIGSKISFVLGGRGATVFLLYSALGSLTSFLVNCNIRIIAAFLMPRVWNKHLASSSPTPQLSPTNQISFPISCPPPSSPTPNILFQRE